MPSIFEITKELTQPNLDKTCELYFAYKEVNAKFIRIGSLILYAPMIECDPIPGQRDNMPQHRSIVMGGFQNTDPVIQAKIREISNAEYENPTASHLDADTGIIDAGHLTYVAGKELVIYGKSQYYQKADELGRAETASIAQVAIDVPITVR